MTASYRLTPRAAEGFLRIALYVDEHFGSEIAERVVDDIEHAFEQLARRPGIGHRREDVTSEDEVRFWAVGPTLIAYRLRPEWLEVLFVERGELDWEALLRKYLD